MLAVLKRYTFADWATQCYLVLVGLLILCFHNPTVPTWRWLLTTHAGLIILIHGLVVSAARGWGGKALAFLRQFYPMFLYAWFYAETARLNRMFIPHYLDATIIHWEQSLFGCQPSLLFMQKLPYLGISELFYFFYFSYYLTIGGVGLALFLRNRRQFLHYLAVVSTLFYICYLFYIALPIIGPPVFVARIDGYTLPPDLQYLVPANPYPNAIRSGLFFRLMAWIYRGFEDPGAALPSSHVAVALCTLYFSFRYLHPIRYLHLVAALLLCLSTVYCRYHYALDVMAGMLTAALVVPITNWLYFRSQVERQAGNCPACLVVPKRRSP